MSWLYFPINHPCGFLIACVVASIYYGSRAPFVQNHYEGKKGWKTGEKIYVLYIQDIIFNVVCTVVGFAAWYLECILVSSIADLSEISVGASALVIFLAVVAITGISGQLPFLFTHGRFPK